MDLLRTAFLIASRTTPVFRDTPFEFGLPSRSVTSIMSNNSNPPGMIVFGHPSWQHLRSKRSVQKHSNSGMMLWTCLSSYGEYRYLLFVTLSWGEHAFRTSTRSGWDEWSKRRVEARSAFLNLLTLLVALQVTGSIRMDGTHSFRMMKKRSQSFHQCNRFDRPTTKFAPSPFRPLQFAYEDPVSGATNSHSYNLSDPLSKQEVNLILHLKEHAYENLFSNLKSSTRCTKSRNGLIFWGRHRRIPVR